MKRNLRKIPDDILEKVKTLPSDELVVGCAIKFKALDLSSGRLEHLGITLSSNGLKVPPSTLPSEDSGKYSKLNIEGEEIVRKDLPKEMFYNMIESPNWGSPYNGTHTTYLPYERYVRDFRPPRELSIEMSCMDKRPALPAYIINFRIDEVISRKQKNFKKTLFENLNLLQENIGACGVEPSSVSLSDYAKSLHVSWEIFPPGTRDEAIKRLFRDRMPTQEEKNTASERYDFFMSLKPKNLVYGSSGFRRYFGALLEYNLVVFENIKYGNAVYIIFEKWEELSTKSRLDLLSGKYEKDFERVVHATDWKRQIREIVAMKREENEKG